MKQNIPNSILTSYVPLLSVSISNLRFSILSFEAILEISFALVEVKEGSRNQQVKIKNYASIYLNRLACGNSNLGN